MCVYAWKDWYRAACFLIISMSIFETPWMPKAVFGISGFNPWNLLLLSTIAAAFANRVQNNSRVRGVLRILIFYYVIFIVVAFLREIQDLSGIVEFRQRYGGAPVTFKEILIEDLLNTFKYTAPAILIYFGCNSKQRLFEAVGAVCILSILLAILVIRSMGFDSLSSGFELNDTAVRRIDRDVGYFRSDLAILFSGAAWALFVSRELFERRAYRLWATFGSALVALALGMTGGRMGIVAWLGVGAMVTFLRYRRLFIFAPIAVVIVVASIPAIGDRLFQGFTYDPNDIHYQIYDSGSDFNPASVTSGRTIVWPHIVDKISESPMIGYGRRAMQRTGLSTFLGLEYGDPFPHPHNAYLQLFLDNGFVLGLPILTFFLLLLKRSYSLFRDPSDNTKNFVGLFGMIYICSFLMGCISQQSFYPYPSSMSMWVAIALVLKVYYVNARQASDRSVRARRFATHEGQRTA